MTLLDLITKSSNNQQTPIQSDYPIDLDSETILLSLNQNEQNSEPTSLIKRVQGWKISDIDTDIIKFGNDFCKKLNRKLKNPSSFNKDEFLKLFNSFLDKNRKKLDLYEKIDLEGVEFTMTIVKKVKFVITPSIAALILEACVGLEIWDLLETLIVEGVIGRFTSSDLIEKLIEKRQSYLLCLCVKNFSDIEFSDVQCMLKYFLSLPKGAQSGLVSVREKWEREALSAVEMLTDGSLDEKNLDLAKQAAVLHMIAYDGFSSVELCLHYLVSSLQLDELKLSYSLGGLDGAEMLKLIRYFGKWLKKYLNFPQARPCPGADSVLGLELCECVLSVESVVKYLGLVLDLQFSSLVLYKDFHDELRSLDADVKSLTSEARFSCSLVDVLDNLKA